MRPSPRGGRFAGLPPGTRYAWTASVDGRARAIGSFRTAPRDPSPPVTFAVIGDYGSGNDHEWAVGRLLAARAPGVRRHARATTATWSAAGPLLDRNIFQPLASCWRTRRCTATWATTTRSGAGGRTSADALDLPGGGAATRSATARSSSSCSGLEANERARSRSPARALAEPGAGRALRARATGRCSRQPAPGGAAGATTSRPSSPATCTATSGAPSTACSSSRSAPAARARATWSSPRRPRTPTCRCSTTARCGSTWPAPGALRFVDERGRVLDRLAP